MSSPISKKRRTLLDSLLVKIHQRTSHASRISRLTDSIDTLVRKLYGDAGELHALDIGCGDMSISAGLSRRRPGLLFDAIDIHDLPSHLQGNPIWNRYKKFDGVNIPFEDRVFSFGLMCDVLHHVPEAMRSHLLQEALRACDILIIKDHFENGWFSRHMLRAMDFVGNYGYGISVPKRYFTESSLRELAKQTDGILDVKERRIDLYSHFGVMGKFFNPEWQFLGVIQKGVSIGRIS